MAGHGRPSCGLFCNDLQCHSRDYWKVEFRVSVFHRYRVSVYWSCMYHLAAVLQHYAGSLIFMKWKEKYIIIFQKVKRNTFNNFYSEKSSKIAT